MEPLEGEVKFGIYFSKLEPGMLGIGLAYTDSKAYWAGQEKIWGESYPVENPTRNIIITLLFFAITIGTLWKETKPKVTLKDATEKAHKAIIELYQEVIRLLHVEQIVRKLSGVKKK